jgi:hypothetical protein
MVSGGVMNPQANAAQISVAQFELIGRLTFENAVLKGDLQQLQAQIQTLVAKVTELTPKPAAERWDHSLYGQPAIRIATEAPNTIGNGTALVIKSPTPASAIAQVELHNQYSGAFAAYCQSVVGNLGRTATVSLYKSHGANLAAAPLAVVANDALGEVEYNGYDGTTYTGLGYTNFSGGIWECDATEDWDSTHHGTALLLSSIVKGTNNTVGCFLRLGGITSGSPAIVKDGAQVHLRLADDSDDAGLIASTSTLTAAAPTVAASKVGLGSTTAATATAGGVQLALATVLGYLVANVGGTTVKIPYFAN